MTVFRIQNSPLIYVFVFVHFIRNSLLKIVLKILSFKWRAYTFVTSTRYFLMGLLPSYLVS